MALSQATVQSLIDFAASDPAFLKELVLDPETAVEAYGIQLQPGELEGLQSLLGQAGAQQDEGAVEQLRSRISHSLVGHDELSRLLLIENFLRSAGGEEE